MDLAVLIDPGDPTTALAWRLPALTTVIWHNETTNQPGPARSLLAYDH